MSTYITEYAKLIMDKHGKTPLARLGTQALADLVASELAPFGPTGQELVSVAVELGVMVGDDARPAMPERKRGRAAMFRQTSPPRARGGAESHGGGEWIA